MLTLQAATHGSIAALRTEYLRTLPAPLDGMGLALLEQATAWELRREKLRIGYAYVSARGHVLQFHVEPEHVGIESSLFRYVLKATGCSGALVSSFEPWLPHCFDLDATCRVHTLLYHDNAFAPPQVPAQQHQLRPIDRPALAGTESFVRSCFPQDLGEWLGTYLENLVARGELFALFDGDMLIGTGELRVSDLQPPCADLGVIVAADRRALGHGTRILAELASRSRARGLTPICSTTVENLGSQRAIERAGFVARHRVALFTLRDPPTGKKSEPAGA